ncbi:MAG: Two-component response regulator [Bacteroidetes bacterium]|nr:Two-component response regulator [Bacteroidota bacterium]
MEKKLDCILLVDDDKDDNFFHKIILEEMNISKTIAVARNGIEALEFLKNENNPTPDLIFLDINMPKMNGWEFLDEYIQLQMVQKAKVIMVMLTTSQNPEDHAKSEHFSEVVGYNSKPLTAEIVTKIMTQNFPDYV